MLFIHFAVELVLFCQPSALQLQLYRQLLASPSLRACISCTDPGQHLMYISALKKLCNHPVLLHESAVKAGAEEEEAVGFGSNVSFVIGFMCFVSSIIVYHQGNQCQGKSRRIIEQGCIWAAPLG